jgi:hypothetical protein
VGQIISPLIATLSQAMTRIVTTTYRYKRPPKMWKPAVLEVPTVVRRPHRSARATREEQAAVEESAHAGEDFMTAPEAKSAIVTVRKRSRIDHADEVTSEELRRRADAADAFMRDFKRELANRHRK